MSSLTGKRAGTVAGVVAGVVALTSSMLGLVAAPGGAATKNPCKVLTKAEIQTALGGAVSSGRKGPSTSVSTQCEFQVGANGDRPDGTVIVHLMTTGAKPAYTGLKKIGATYAPIDGFPNALYAEKLQVVNVLKGDVLLGVQGNFLVTAPLPIHRYDDQAQLVDLAKLGLARV
jgi:hypothetical protein